MSVERKRNWAVNTCTEDDVNRYLKIFGRRVARVFDRNPDGLTITNADGEDITETGNPYLELFEKAKPHILDLWMNREISMEGIQAINNLLQYSEMQEEFVKLMDYIDKGTHVEGSSVSFDGGTLNTNHIPRFSHYGEWSGNGHAGWTLIERLKKDVRRTSDFGQWIESLSATNGFKITSLGIYGENGKLICEEVEGFNPEDSHKYTINGKVYYTLSYRNADTKKLIDENGEVPKIQLYKIFGGTLDVVMIKEMWQYEEGVVAISWWTNVGGNSWGTVNPTTGALKTYFIGMIPRNNAGVLL